MKREFTHSEFMAELKAAAGGKAGLSAEQIRSLSDNPRLSSQQKSFLTGYLARLGADGNRTGAPAQCSASTIAAVNQGLRAAQSPLGQLVTCNAEYLKTIE
jgi:hypothetical protein